MSKNSGASYDSRKYDCCAPYYGDIGEEFTRRFKPEFEGALHMFVDQFASLYDHVVLQNDPGSAASPLGAAAAYAPARLAFALRQKKSFGIDTNAMGDGPAAWTLINQLCSRPQTYLNLAAQDKEWNDASLHDVGISERTVENFRALLERINRERPIAQLRSNIQVWQKLLEAIGSAGNAELKIMVRNELQVPTLTHPPGHPLVGEPDIPQYVLRFSERWRVLIHNGTIKQAPARRHNPPTGNRVDAMLVSTNSTADSPAQAFAASNTQSEQPERMCWNCRGLGHTKIDSNNKLICPSPIKSRSITTAIAALEAHRRREAGRGGRRKVFVKRPANVTAKSAQSDKADDYVEVLVDDDGGVYSNDGVYLGSVVDLEPSEIYEATEITDRN